MNNNNPPSIQYTTSDGTTIIDSELEFESLIPTDVRAAELFVKFHKWINNQDKQGLALALTSEDSDEREAAQIIAEYVKCLK